jgi:hypothetical protein
MDRDRVLRKRMCQRTPHTGDKAYGDAIDAAGYNEGVGERFYSSTVVHHIQNNAEYHGATQTWEWIRQLFKHFKRLQHQIHVAREIARPDGTYTLDIRMTRRIWIKSADGPPDVSAPVTWSCII